MSLWSDGNLDASHRNLSLPCYIWSAGSTSGTCPRCSAGSLKSTYPLYTHEPNRNNASLLVSPGFGFITV